MRAKVIVHHPEGQKSGQKSRSQRLPFLCKIQTSLPRCELLLSNNSRRYDFDTLMRDDTGLRILVIKEAGGTGHFSLKQSIHYTDYTIKG